jgi:predicted permease
LIHTRKHETIDTTMIGSTIRLCVVLAASLLVALVLALPASATSESIVVTAKSCSSGYTHAIIGGEHKCLRRGQFCAIRYDRTYHRYGFHCHTGRLR